MNDDYNRIVKNHLINAVDDLFFSIKRQYKQATNKEGRINYFIGGSFRFKYDNSFSDIDLFVTTDGDDSIDFSNYFRRILHQKGFKSTSNEMRDYPVDVIFLNKKYNIHLLYMEHFKDYVLLKEEHNRVEELLNNNPQILRFINILKNYDIKGKFFYRALVNMFKQ